MKKKIMIPISICLAICVAAILGNFYGKRNSRAELPVFESMAIYPEFSISELVDISNTIVNATVVAVGDTYMEKIDVSLTENPNEASEIVYVPITPITLEVETNLKGNETADTLIYYEEGGTTSTYIQLPAGYAMEEGMEVILFLNDKGYSWGEQSIFPVVENEVILNKTALNFLDDSDVSVINTSEIENSVRSQITDATVSVMGKEEFLSMLEDLINN